MPPVTLLVVILAVTPFANAAAQEPPSVKVGDRVRVTHACVLNARGGMK